MPASASVATHVAARVARCIFSVAAAQRAPLASESHRIPSRSDAALSLPIAPPATTRSALPESRRSVRPHAASVAPSATAAPTTAAPTFNWTAPVASKKKKMHSISPDMTFAAAAVLVFGGIFGLLAALVCVIMTTENVKAVIRGPKPALSPSEASRKGEFWAPQHGRTTSESFCE